MPKNVQTTIQLHSSPTQQSNSQNSPGEASTACELRTSRCSSWIQKRQRNQRSNSQYLLDHRKRQESSIKKKIYFCFIDYSKAFDCVDHNKMWKILQDMGIPDHFTYLPINLYAGQQADMEQWTGSKLGKEYIKTVYCHTAYLTYMLLLLLLLLSHFSRVRLCETSQTAAHQAPPSLGFSRQEHWSGLPFPSPMHESEK